MVKTALGAGGRQFESARPDHSMQAFAGLCLAIAKSPVADFEAVAFLRVQQANRRDTECCWQSRRARATFCAKGIEAVDTIDSRTALSSIASMEIVYTLGSNL